MQKLVILSLLPCIATLAMHSAPLAPSVTEAQGRIIVALDSAANPSQAIAEIIAESDAETLAVYAEAAEELLYEPSSSWYDEELMYLFADAMAEVVDNPLSQRYSYIVSDICRNSPGVVAPDFDMLRRNGTSATLHAMVASTPMNVVMFYDPECDTCHGVMNQLKDLYSEGRVNLIAIYPDGDRELWDSHRGTVETPWTDAFALSDIQEADYNLRFTPTLFLLDNNATVILKNTTPTKLRRHIASKAGSCQLP